MVKLTALYGAPADPAAFDAYYADHHAPLVAKIPDLRRFEVAHCVGTRDGSPPNFATGGATVLIAAID